MEAIAAVFTAPRPSYAANKLLQDTRDRVPALTFAYVLRELAAPPGQEVPGTALDPAAVRSFLNRHAATLGRLLIERPARRGGPTPAAGALDHAPGGRVPVLQNRAVEPKANKEVGGA